MVIVMSATNIIQQYISQVKTDIRHPYLDKYITHPVIEPQKVKALNIILTDTISEPTKTTYIKATLFVQLALHTHDFIDLNNAENETMETTKKRQLRVLAGDYYSGLYYQLLSKNNEIEFIRILANAIKDTTDTKMTVYYKKHSSILQFIDEFANVDSKLILAVLKKVNTALDATFIQNWLTYHLLRREQKLLDKGETSVFIELLQKNFAKKFTNKVLSSKLIDAMTHYKKKLEKSDHQLSNAYDDFSLDTEEMMIESLDPVKEG